MVTPLGTNILVMKKEETSQLIIFNDDNFLYEVIACGDKTTNKLVGKTVFIKEGLIKLDYNNITYYLVDEKDILAVVED